MLMRPEYRNKIDPKYKKKIEAMVRWAVLICAFRCTQYQGFICNVIFAPKAYSLKARSGSPHPFIFLSFGLKVLLEFFDAGPY